MNLYEDIIDWWSKKKIETVNDLDLLLSNFRILFAYHSGKLENPNISYHTTREIFEDGMVQHFRGDPRSLFEIQNQKLCYDFLAPKIVMREPLSMSLLLECHGILLAGCYDVRRFLVNGERPGTFKKHDYVVGITEAGSDVEDVESDMSSLIDEANSDAAVQNVLKAGAYFHVNFENIHPFADGNGRVGRTLLNYWFLINRHPPVIIFDEDRESYYNAFEEFDRNLTLVPMVDFLRHEVEKTWGKKPVLEKSIKLSNYL